MLMFNTTLKLDWIGTKKCESQLDLLWLGRLGKVDVSCSCEYLVCSPERLPQNYLDVHLFLVYVI